MKRENEDKEFVSLIEDETRDYKNLRKELKDKIDEEKKEESVVVEEKITEVVTPIEEHSCNCGGECNCNDGCGCGNDFNKTSILIIILVGLFALGLGTVLGKLYLNEEAECDPCPQTKCKELDYQNFNGSDIELNNKKDMEDYLNSSFLSFEKDARTCFIDTNACHSFDEYKVAYVMVHNFEGNGVVKYKDLVHEIKEVFKTGIEREEFSMTMLLQSSIVNVICTNDICTYDISVAGATGHSFYKYVINNYNETRNGFTYVIQEYYVVPGVGGEVDKVYDKEDGTLLYEGNEYEFDYKQHSDKLNTYEFEFNKNFKFIGSKLVK